MPRPDHVPPGKWGTQIVFWSPVTKKVQNEQGDLEDDRFFVLRLYTVFNVDQVEGLDHLRAGQPDTDEPLTVDYEPADEALEAALGGMGVSLRYGGGQAFYSPQRTSFRCRPRRRLSPWTSTTAPPSTNAFTPRSIPSRLDWSRKERDKTYALGELVAELGGVLRLPGTWACQRPMILTNHTAYLAYLAPGHEERSSLHLHGVSTSQQERRLSPELLQEARRSA